MSPSPSLQEVIDRMNYIGALDADERAQLEALCTSHLPTAGYFCTIPPLYVCFNCGARFKLVD